MTRESSAPGSLSRRDVLRRAALAVAAAGVHAAGPDPAAAQAVHSEAARRKSEPGGYAPRFFTRREYQTVTRLSELIVPADERSGSAVDAGAPEFIDLLCAENTELARIYSGGLGWIDAWMRQRHGTSFLRSSAIQQTGLLDQLVAAEQAADTATDKPGIAKPGEMEPGVNFFQWIRKMAVDAYYTSEIGVADLGYQGNTALETYTVPAEAIEYVRKRSPLG